MKIIILASFLAFLALLKAGYRLRLVTDDIYDEVEYRLPSTNKRINVRARNKRGSRVNAPQNTLLTPQIKIWGVIVTPKILHVLFGFLLFVLTFLSLGLGMTPENMG